MTEVGERLIARTTKLPAPVDPLLVAGADGVLFVRDGHGFAGTGPVERVPAADVVQRLAELRHGPGSVGGAVGPVAFATVPFLPGRATEFLVPSVAVQAGPDGSHLTTIGTDDGGERHQREAERLVAATRRPPEPGPGSFTVRSSRTPEAWTDAVGTATERIRSGALEKVVLAREVVVEADGPIPVDAVLLRLARGYPHCFLFLVDGFCGASPELLVSRHADVVRAQPMAGTVPRRGDPQDDARMVADLLASPTYRHEHQVTIDAVHDTLLAFSSYVDYEPEPSVVALANVSHLATSVEGRLSHPAASVLELVTALHPTPAICGRPRQAALDLIAELEDLDRDRYAGAVGWVDADGNGEWAVSIRCATIEGSTAQIVAGNGIVGDSDPATELIETRAKLQALLGAIVRP